MGLSCQLGIARIGPAKAKFCWRNVQFINPLLTKLDRSRWLNIGLVLYCVFMNLDFLSGHAILTSRLVNNAYILYLK